MLVKNRIFYYDMLRTLAILCVILCHTSPFYNLMGIASPANLIIPYTLYNLATMGVPLFFMISGALLLNKKDSISVFLKKRFTRILYPFLFWIAIILAGVYYINGTTYLLDMFLGIGQFTWFIWVLMGLYLFIPIFSPFIEKYGIKGVEYYLIFWLITIILTALNQYPFGRLDLTLFSGYFGVLVLGYYLDNKDFKIDDNKICTIGLIIFLICLIIMVYLNYANYVTGFSFDSCEYLNIITITMASGLYIFIKYLNQLNSLGANIKNAVTSVSMCSYGMYFTHIIVVRPFLLYFNHHSLLESGIIFIIVCFASWLIIYIFSKIPYLKKVSGV